MTTAAIVALASSLLARRRRRWGVLGLDDWALALGLLAGLLGALATALAWVGMLGPQQLTLGCIGLAIVAWPWFVTRDRCPPTQRPGSLPHTGALLLIVALGVALRLPAIAAPLAGRDQGTYALRAAASLRTGELGWNDAVLASAGAQLDGRETPAGALDLLGLYPVSDEPWRAGVYEGAYRPGSYLAARSRGEVVPQFFHLHPMLLAVGGAALGPRGIVWCPVWIAGLGLLCFACVARRLWPRGPWAPLCLALVAGSPLAIWVGRTPLSENPMALFEWAALLAALRLSAGVERAREGAWWVAAFLALCAGVRGNALVILPVVLALAWLRPRDTGAAAAYLALGGLWASVALHAATSFPYVHDEILRRLPALAGGPAPLVYVTTLAAGAWIAIDRRLPRARLERLRELAQRWMVPVLAALCAVAWALWASQRIGGSAGAPYSRLDAAPVLLGLPLLLSAGAGLVLLALRWRPQPRQLWLLALAAVVPATTLLYVPRGLPTLAFFYYGRYLVPELLPAAALLACFALERFVARIEPARPRLARGAGLVLGAGLLASVSTPLILAPQLRLQEYEPAAEAVDWLAAQLPDDAVLIAGGEGWHNGHTYNQVGGALAMAHGVSVVPYRTREDAWISAWELLVAGPERRGEPPPPVYLLLNEAAHPVGEGEGESAGGRRALLDDQLWAPFALADAKLLELYVHALTPTPDALPTRVARHELRMALLELRVDADARAQMTRVELERCVAPNEVLRFELPRPPEAAHLVLVAGGIDEHMARRVPKWRVRLDGELAALEPPSGLRPHPRATLGPLPLPPAPAKGAQTSVRVEIRGADMGAYADPSARCPHGRLDAIYVLPRERSALTELAASGGAIEAQRFAPADELGHAIGPTRWVTGRSLSRYRPGIRPAPVLSALALVLEPGESLEFAPIDLPLARSEQAQARRPEPSPIELVVTLAHSDARAGSRLEIHADDELVARVELPAARRSSWVSEAIRWQGVRDRARLRVTLDGDAGGSVALRDLALFRVEGP